MGALAPPVSRAILSPLSLHLKREQQLVAWATRATTVMFDQLDLAGEIIDGNSSAIRAYLGYFWSHRAGRGYHQTEADLDRLAKLYAPAGAFTASVGWYRAGDHGK